VVNVYVNFWKMNIIKFYKNIDGDSPVEEFLDNLSTKDALKVTWVLKLVEETKIIPKTYFKKLIDTDEIWEIRINSRSNAFRLLCFRNKGNIIILTNGFKKKTEKTPKNEIKLAEKRRFDWIRRNE
jgi:phage-related protein